MYGAMREKYVRKAVDDTGMGLVFSELCRWEVGVRLGWLPMTGIFLNSFIVQRLFTLVQKQGFQNCSLNQFG